MTMITIKEIREMKGKSIETLAGEVGVSTSSIKNWERDSAKILSSRLDNAIELCKSLGINIEYLISTTKKE